MTEPLGVMKRLLHRLLGQSPQTSAAPLIVLDLDYSQGRLFMILANTGTEAALDITVTFDKPLTGLGGTRDFSSLPLFSGLPVLRPGREIRLFFEAGPSIGSIGRFTARTHWSSVTGAEQVAEYVHDTAIYRAWPEAII